MKIKSLSKPKKKCKRCASTDVYKSNLCYEHFKEYAREYRQKNLEKARQYDRDRYNNGVKRKCKQCGEIFSRRFGGDFCSKPCTYTYWKGKGIRKGKKNPGCKSGLYIGGKWASSKTGAKHLRMCKKYRTEFLENNNYCWCELCGVSNSFKFEVHHIVFASEAPLHKELHNFKNMIMLCIDCHNKLHTKKGLRDELVKNRGLEELFNRKLIYDRGENKSIECK